MKQYPLALTVLVQNKVNVQVKWQILKMKDDGEFQKSLLFFQGAIKLPLFSH